MFNILVCLCMELRLLQKWRLGKNVCTISIMKIIEIKIVTSECIQNRVHF